MKSKEELRKDILKKRMSLSEEEICDKSLKISDTILKLDLFKNSLNIMCYVDFKNEVSTKRLILQAISMKKNVSVPYITNNNMQENIMTAAIIKSYEKDLEPGKYGIYAPKRDEVKYMIPYVIDCIIVPGVAFDMNKNRIGYGAGYYDRFLNLLKPDCLKIGIAFEIQLIDEIPIDAHDKKMDIIITEARVI
jgi:5-formyltetrahydrofolate cyclo-ligase